MNARFLSALFFLTLSKLLSRFHLSFMSNLEKRSVFVPKLWLIWSSDTFVFCVFKVDCFHCFCPFKAQIVLNFINARYILSGGYLIEQSFFLSV